MTIAAPFIASALLGLAQAQVPAATVATLDLHAGEKVIVTTARETIRGRVLRLADEGLVLDAGGARHTVPLRDLDRVERRRDSIWNGALIGYGTGFVAGFALVLATPCGPHAFLCSDGPEFGAAFGGIITGPIGMATGTIADALIKRPRVVFDRRAASHDVVAVVPVIVRAGGGLRVVMTF